MKQAFIFIVLGLGIFGILKWHKKQKKSVGPKKGSPKKMTDKEFNENVVTSFDSIPGISQEEAKQLAEQMKKKK